MTQKPSGLSLAKQINAKGFRQWHEAELARSFGYLGLGVILLVAGLALMEGIMDIKGPAERVFKMLLSFFSLCFTGWSWFRFLWILIVAESISRQAVCKQCKRYGRIEITDERSSEDLNSRILTCQCKKCGHLWQLHYALQFRDARI